MKNVSLIVVASLISFYAGQALAGSNCPFSGKHRKASRGPAYSVAQAHLSGGAIAPGKSHRKVR